MRVVRSGLDPIVPIWYCLRTSAASRSDAKIQRGASCQTAARHPGVRRLRSLRMVRQDREEIRDAIAQLATVADHVDGPVLQQEFGALETFGQRFAHGLLDHART